MSQLGFSFDAGIAAAQPEPPSPRARPTRAAQTPDARRSPRPGSPQNGKGPTAGRERAASRVEAMPSGAQLSWIDAAKAIARALSIVPSNAPGPAPSPLPRATVAAATAATTAAAAAPAARGRRKKRGGPELRLQTELEQQLKEHIGAPVLVSFTDNTSTMISFKRRGRAFYLRVHRMFGGAPAPVVLALGSFVSKDQTTRAEAKLLDDWIERHRDSLNSARADALKPQPFGEVYDLVGMFDDLNARYFGGKIEAQITWTRAAKNQRRTSIHMGTYSDELRLIRIHPALDQAWVPKFFVEFVVFHEMLHQVHQVGPHEGGRREVHSRAFRRDEARFLEYREARAWERQNLKRLLRY